MSFTNKLILLVVICNLSILIGMGHGVAPLGFMEAFTLYELFVGNLDLAALDFNDNKIYLISLLALGEQLLLLITIFLVKPLKTYLATALVVFMIITFALLVVDFSIWDYDSVSLLFGIPFVFSVIALLLNLGKHNN